MFGPGRYQPQTPEGQRLLAHELTHVVQQGAGGIVIQRYVESTEPISPFWEGVKDVGSVLSPIGGIVRGIAAAVCLSDLERPLGDITFNRWIPRACGRSTSGYLHSREWDAFGHCWIGCEGSRQCGRGPTEVAGSTREVYREIEDALGGDPHDSFRQDMNNQALGRELAATAGTCFSLCDAAHRGNILDLSAPQRTCANCSTYPRSGSEGACPSPPAPSPAAEREAREQEQQALEERLRQEYQSCLSIELERPGGIPSPEEQAEAREKCRQQTGYPQ